MCVTGIGAVSPAGWGVTSLRAALDRGESVPITELARPGLDRPLLVRKTSAASPRPPSLAHARLRRTSPIAHYAVSAALEALGTQTTPPGQRLGVVYCSMTGCVNYSRRFYDEVLKDPATASPLVFPETVYNSPSSHLAALIGTTEINYTLVGDPGTFIQGIALAADWLLSEQVDACLVVGAEEVDWLAGDAMRLFDPGVVIGDGAGALCLERFSDSESVELFTSEGGKGAVRLGAISAPHLFHDRAQRKAAAQAARIEMRTPGEALHLLCDSILGNSLWDGHEKEAWKDWLGNRLSVKSVLGEAFMAAAAWQCVAAVDAVRSRRYSAATVSVLGCNQQAIAARFTA